MRHFRALEAIFDELAPDVVVPEVGSETMRTAAHQIALARGAQVLFLFYTIFPHPLRLYRDTMHAPIVAADELRALTTPSARRSRRFIARFTAARQADPRVPRRARDPGASCATSPATSRSAPTGTATTSTCGRTAS